jgi:hypothetical protein
MVLDLVPRPLKLGSSYLSLLGGLDCELNNLVETWDLIFPKLSDKLEVDGDFCWRIRSNFDLNCHISFYFVKFVIEMILIFFISSLKHLMLELNRTLLTILGDCCYE